MKNKGFTLLETLTVALISAFIFGVLLGVFVVGKNTWVMNSDSVELQQKARLAMERIAQELSLSQSAKVTLEKNHALCKDDLITFQAPQVNDEPIAGTVYNAAGTIKWGADEATNKYIKYFVPTSSSGACLEDYAGRLIRLVDTSNTLLPCGASLKKSFDFKAFAFQFLIRLASAGVYGVYHPPLLTIATNVEKIQFDGYNLQGNPVSSYPSIIKITITASKTNILGQNITFVLQSNVRLKN